MDPKTQAMLDRIRQLFSSGTPSAQDSINALSSFLLERNIAPPRMLNWGGGVYYGSDRPVAGSENWAVGGYGEPSGDLWNARSDKMYPPPYMNGGQAGIVPHEIAHILQNRSLGEGYYGIDKERQLYGEDVYTTPWTLENDATTGLGLSVQKLLSQKIEEERQRRLKGNK